MVKCGGRRDVSVASVDGIVQRLSGGTAKRALKPRPLRWTWYNFVKRATCYVLHLLGRGWGAGGVKVLVFRVLQSQFQPLAPDRCAMLHIASCHFGNLSAPSSLPPP